MDIILARDINGGIGLNGGLPWHFPEDLKHFKELTVNSRNLICGRTTFESLPPQVQKRVKTIISTKPVQNQYNNKCKTLCNPSGYMLSTNERVTGTNILIGGSCLFNYEYFHRAERIFETVVKKAYKCDTFIDEKSLEYLNSLHNKPHYLIYEDDEIIIRELLLA